MSKAEENIGCWVLFLIVVVCGLLGDCSKKDKKLQELEERISELEKR